MKFRSKHGQRLLILWEPPSIPYQQLKAAIKAATCNGQPLSEEFFIKFVQIIEVNIAFSLQRASGLQLDEEHLESHWNHVVLAEHRSSLLRLDLMSLQDALEELLWFYRTNQEAMNRICIKLARSDRAHNPAWEEHQQIIQKHLAEHRKAYKKCVEQLDRVQARVAMFQTAKSSNWLDSHSLDQKPEIAAAIFHDGASITRNGHGQSPLHFAATHGMVNLCSYTLSTICPIDRNNLLQDGAGFTPLHLSVACGHVEITQLLLSALDESLTLTPDNLLHIALRREDDTMVKLLISRSVGVKHKNSSEESCLHIAAQLGRADYLRQLIPILGSDFLNATESACQWTPLFIGCVEGHVSTVQLLLDAGADTALCDYLGWTAQENAAFRGHMPVAKLFSAVNTTPKATQPLLSTHPQRKRSSYFDISPGLTYVVLNLGGLQDRKLSKSSTLNLFGTCGHGLALSISTSESHTRIERMIPLLDDPVDDTMVFPVQNPREAAIIFNVHKSTIERDDQSAPIGSGVAFLCAQNTSLGDQHGTLLREQSVPILCKDSLKVLGAITFSFLIVKSSERLKPSSPAVTCFETPSSVQLVGHRGFGQNSRKRLLQLGENTIQSFLTAANQGATFVEFDVQLTKDLIPVLFHDYSLSESGTDVPIHDVTLAQFLHASRIQSPRGNPPSKVGSSELNADDGDARLQRPRSRSATITYENGAGEVQHRMKHTVDYLNRGFKPNTRGDFIHDTFATLEDVLCNIPADVGFDMEIKYPRLHEALEAGMAPVSIDINIFVDTILDVIARFGHNRKIILSSFTPEICILLTIKQTLYPVVLISNAGKRPVSDKEKRAGSLQVAVRFAKQWGLAGIVVAADSLVMCPRLIGFIKSQGLICGSYNGLNDEPANVELQVNMGIDLIVADRVGLISQTLEKLSSAK